MLALGILLGAVLATGFWAGLSGAIAGIWWIYVRVARSI